MITDRVKLTNWSCGVIKCLPHYYIGGIEGVTNYFHCVGCGHVVWMCRQWGNLWRYRNEGVEAFNKIVSVRHNQHNGNGGRKRTRAGEPVQTCPEFWSLGQWLGRWSIWQLGYGDCMDPDHLCSSQSTTPHGIVHLTRIVPTLTPMKHIRQIVVPPARMGTRFTPIRTTTAQWPALRFCHVLLTTCL